MTLNLHSFDYLELKASDSGETYFELVQENRVLRLDVAKNPHQVNPLEARSVPDGALEEMVTQVLSARWDVQMDDDEHFNF